ncbi:hypothetical protein V1286_005468 [Bradyrhizobium algeriense]|uniref:Transposase n=1 Tax=Bradyrhizobium algeriense TaxID=634784 RepID=A0ABU8BHA6_9BRAD
MARSPGEAKRNPGPPPNVARIPDYAEPVIGRAFARPVGSIRACMGLWLSRGMIDQGMCCSRSLSWSALRSQWLFRSDG